MYSKSVNTDTYLFIFYNIYLIPMIQNVDHDSEIRQTFILCNMFNVL